MRKRKGGESKVQRGKKKIKILNAHTTITMHIYTITIAIVHLYYNLISTYANV